MPRATVERSPPSPVIAKPVRTPAVAIRIPVLAAAGNLSSPVLRPPVPRKPLGNPMGATAPLVVGEGVQRGPPRNRSPLARLCLLSPRCERRSLPQERNRFRAIFRPRRSELSPKHPADSPFVSAICSHVPSPPAGDFLWLAQRKSPKKCAKGNRVVARVNGRYPAFGRIPARFPRLLLFKSKRFVSI